MSDYWTEEAKYIHTLEDRLQTIEAILKKLTKKVSWEEKTTESGIQLSGGPTTVSRFGDIMAACPIQVGPTQMTIAFCVQEDSSGKIFVVPAEACKFVNQD